MSDAPVAPELPVAPAAEAEVVPVADGLAVPDPPASPVPADCVPADLPVAVPVVAPPPPAVVVDAASLLAPASAPALEEPAFPAVALLAALLEFTFVVASLVVVETALDTFLTALPVITRNGTVAAALVAAVEAGEAYRAEAEGGCGPAAGALVVPESAFTSVAPEIAAATRA